MYISKYNNMEIGISCNTFYKKCLFWKDCLKEGINIVCDRWLFNDDYTLFFIRNKTLNLLSYSYCKKSNWEIIDYELPKDNIKNISNGIIFQKKGKRTIAKKVINGKTIKKRSSLCHDDDIFIKSKGEIIAAERLIKDLDSDNPMPINNNIEIDYLVSIINHKSCYGKIGEITDITYNDGTFAHVGDLVIVKPKDTNKIVSNVTVRPVVALHTHSDSINESFVMGLYNCKFIMGNSNNYTIIKYINYKELKQYELLLSDSGLCITKHIE